MNLPKHIGIIMDGNGRWAIKRGLKRSEGHKKGGKTLEKIALHAKNLGIKYLSVYAFSTDNFKRSEEEVNNLRKDVIEAMDNIILRTQNNTDCVLNICLNYGGEEEIVDASIKLAHDLNQGLIKKEDITRESFYKYLYQDLPPLDLLIRTGKEKRLSNFMLYQMYYAEIYFSNLYFPDFKEKDLDKAILFYQKKDRRFGSVKTD